MMAWERCASRLVCHGLPIGGIDLLVLLPCTSRVFPPARTIHRSLAGAAVPLAVTKRTPSSRSDRAHAPVPGRDEPTFDAPVTRAAEADSGRVARGRRRP